MALTVTNRMVMYVGGFRQTMMRAEGAAAAATDDSRLRLAFARGGVSVAPISTTTGAGDMTVTWTTVTQTALGAMRGYVLMSLSNATLTEVGSFIGWGW